jgi:hypothetical protein
MRGFVFVTVLIAAAPAAAQTMPASPGGQASQPPPVDRLRDRGEGVRTSLFGTYIRRGELLIYPFYEYYRDRDYEYSPEELGYGVDEDFRGRYRANEGLIFLAFGLTDDLAVEFEAAVISATLDKSAADPSGFPARLAESGLGDVEGQVRWRWRRETEAQPEWFSYFEAVAPRAKEKLLIGTPGWELKFGTGVTRGLSWGTLTARASIQYEQSSSSHFDLGEYAIEYLRRFSPAFRLYLGVEGTQDEVELISELQWHLGRRVYLKFNNGFGVTSKATDWAPEVGVMFSFGTR